MTLINDQTKTLRNWVHRGTVWYLRGHMQAQKAKENKSLKLTLKKKVENELTVTEILIG